MGDSWDDILDSNTISKSESPADEIKDAIETLNKIKKAKQMQTQYSAEAEIKSEITKRASDECENCGAGSKLDISEFETSCKTCGEKKEIECISKFHISSINNMGVKCQKASKRTYDATKSVQVTQFDTLCACGKITREESIMAAEVYNKIKGTGLIFRGSINDGVRAACLYYACSEMGDARPRRDVSEMLSVNEQFMSKGDRILQSWKERNSIAVPVYQDHIKSFIKLYSHELKIDLGYAAFMVELIERVKTKNLRTESESRPSTQCAGSIHMLSVRKKLGITVRQIEVTCKISGTTFLRFYNLMCSNYIQLRKVFIRHKIPMPKEWDPIYDAASAAASASSS